MLVGLVSAGGNRKQYCKLKGKNKEKGIQATDLNPKATSNNDRIQNLLGI